MYDVIIVGLGPAGSMTALSIAENSGLNVLAVDRKKEIRVPVSCAGGIPINRLNKVGLEVLNTNITGLTKEGVKTKDFDVLKDFKLKSSDRGRVLEGKRASKGFIWRVFLKDPVIIKDLAFGLARRVKGQ